jgi:hypothetical protein
MMNEEEETVLDIDARELPDLVDTHELLVWPTSPARHPGLCRIKTPASRDGIYHAILNAVSRYYRERNVDGFKVDTDTQVRMFREELADELGSGPVGSRPYDLIGGGKPAQMAHRVPQYSLRAMRQHLLHDGYIEPYVLPYVCDAIGHDIIYISALDRDVATFSQQTDSAIKGRPTILLLYSRNHYELLGILDGDGDLETRVSPQHPYIQRLRGRIGILEDEELMT